MFDIIPMPQLGVLPVQHNDVHEVTKLMGGDVDIAPQVTSFVTPGSTIQYASATDEGPRPPQGKFQIEMVAEIGTTDVGPNPPNHPRIQMMSPMVAEIGQTDVGQQPPNHPK